jgi:hypothetical protein
MTIGTPRPREKEARQAKCGTLPLVVAPAALQWVIWFSFGMRSDLCTKAEECYMTRLPNHRR